MKKYQKLINGTLISCLAISPIGVFALQKSETIYTNLDYHGNPYKTVVSNHLSWLEESTIEDNTELENILNIGGNETFEKNNNQLSWKSLGNDIFYQGETETELPIKTNIKYYLNDEEKTVEEMLGKEGKIKIQINFQNTLKQEVKVNGVNTTLYTPFVTMIGTMLDNSTNEKIQINNGKIINTGSRNMIVGLSAPGLYDSMKLEELKDLDEIILTYETKSFSLNNIYIVSTPKLLEETDLTIFDKMDELYNDMHELQKNMDILEKGINELEQGASKLTNGSKELTNGLKSANTAIETLKSGANTLDNGLNQIISSLKNANSELANTNLESSLKDLSTLKTQNTNTINTLIKKTGMSETELANMYQKYNLQTYNGTDQNLIAIKSSFEMVSLLKANNQAIDTTISTLKNLSGKLSTLLNTLNQALASAENGAKQLNNGLNELKKGISNLYNGSVTLNNGTEQLYIGATKLSKGASEFNKLGIQKLNRYVNTLKIYSNKIEALTNLCEEYKGFTSNNSDNTNFISVVKSAKISYKR